MMSVVMLSSRLAARIHAMRSRYSLAGVLALHGRQHACAAALHRQVHVIAKRGHVVHGLDDLAREVARVRGGKAHAADALHACRPRPAARRRCACRQDRPIGVHVLPEQLNLRQAGSAHAGEPRRGRSEGAAALASARVGHHAVGAELVAALDDGDVSAMRVDARGELGLEGLFGLAVVEPVMRARRAPICTSISGKLR